MGKEESRDKNILAFTDYLIVQALTAEYEYFASLKTIDYAKLDAIRRQAVSIRQKDVYKNMFTTENNGIYVDEYNYATNVGTKDCLVFTVGSDGLNFEDRFVGTSGFIIGLEPRYGWIISLVTAAADPNFGLGDFLAEAIGNIPGIGPVIGALDYINDMLNPSYTVDDMRIQLLLRTPNKAPYLEYETFYTVKSGEITSIDRMFHWAANNYNFDGSIY